MDERMDKIRSIIFYLENTPETLIKSFKIIPTLTKRTYRSNEKKRKTYKGNFPIFLLFLFQIHKVIAQYVEA